MVDAAASYAKNGLVRKLKPAFASNVVLSKLSEDGSFGAAKTVDNEIFVFDAFDSQSSPQLLAVNAQRCVYTFAKSLFK